jgi:hypothetical protein
VGGVTTRPTAAEHMYSVAGKEEKRWVSKWGAKNFGVIKPQKPKNPNPGTHHPRCTWAAAPPPAPGHFPRVIRVF